MRFSSLVYSKASGSVGGLTYSHNKAGMYTRTRSTPVNPNTARQIAVRNAVGVLTSRWKETLTAGQRAAWDTYAVNTPVTDKMGDTQLLTGLNWYVACNTLRIQCSLSIVDDGPTTYGLATLTPITATITASTKTAAVTFTNTDDWAGEVGGALLVYGSTGKSPTINFFKGPYRYANKIAGAVSPPASPANVVLVDALTAGQKVFLKAVAIRADGRISSPFRLSGTAA